MGTKNTTPQPLIPKFTEQPQQIIETNTHNNLDLLMNTNISFINPTIPEQNLPNIDYKNSVVLLSNSNPNVLNSNIKKFIIIFSSFISLFRVLNNK